MVIVPLICHTVQTGHNATAEPVDGNDDIAADGGVDEGSVLTTQDAGSKGYQGGGKSLESETLFS